MSRPRLRTLDGTPVQHAGPVADQYAARTGPPGEKAQSNLGALAVGFLAASLPERIWQRLRPEWLWLMPLIAIADPSTSPCPGFDGRGES